MKKGTKTPKLTKRDVVAERLFESERLFKQFKELTPYPYTPFGKAFSSFSEYERWKRAQKNPWYR